MIVRKQQDGSLILVNQTDHAKLSAQFAAHWGNEVFATLRPRESMIRAAMFHDFGWNRYESAPIYEPATKTAPTFFEVPNSDAQLTEFGNAIHWMMNIDEYAGLLISRHRTGLWRQRYGLIRQPTPLNKAIVEPQVQAFIAKFEAEQDAFMGKYDRHEFLTNYQLLQFLDVFSLAFCVREFAGAIFDPVPLGYGDTSKTVQIDMSVRSDGAVVAAPYPFDKTELRFSYVFRHLPCSDFASEEVFREAYFGAPLQLKEIAFVAPATRPA
ncbi:MAG: DUF3891 family protein [Methylovirgula sp.]